MNMTRASSEVGPGQLEEQIQCKPFYMLLLVHVPYFSVNKVRGRKRCIPQSCWVKHPSPRWELYKERTHAKTPTMQVAPTGWMGVLGSMARDHASILKHTPTIRRFTELQNPRRSISELGEMGT